MRNYVERAKDFVEQIFPYINECRHPWDTRQHVLIFNADFTRNVQVRSGLSRIALITSDYVVKYDYDPEEVESIGGCQNECDLYEWAKTEGFGYLFAEITPFRYENRTFYIMPRIRGIGSGRYYAEHYMNDKEKDFCRRYRVTDLHTDNYGFRKGKVCVIDYACHLSYESTSGYECYYENRTNPDELSE